MDGSRAVLKGSWGVLGGAGNYIDIPVLEPKVHKYYYFGLFVFAGYARNWGTPPNNKNQQILRRATP